VTVKARPVAAYLNLRTSDTVEGLDVRNEDIFIVHDDGSTSMYFDGSDLGIGPLAIDAFALTNAGNPVLSFTEASPLRLPGIGGYVDDSDLVRFVADSLGPRTSGRFVRYLDGSNVGLATDDEDIDAVDIRGTGDIVVSTTGDANVPGVAAVIEGSDLIRFNPSSLGRDTDGSWHAFFDGSDVGLSGVDENVDAAASGAHLMLSTAGDLVAGGLTAGPADVARLHPTHLGATTTGWLAGLFFNGSSLGVRGNNVGALELP
jgi:hypothetical protein